MLFLDSCSINVIIKQPPNGLFSNFDTLYGEVSIKSKLKVRANTLNVSLNVTSSTILLDTKGTFVKCENRNLYTETVALIIDDIITPNNNVFPFKFVFPGTSQSKDSFNLPPSMQYINKTESTKIDYSVDALLERSSTKSPLTSSQAFMFAPNAFCTSYSLAHNKSLPTSMTEESFCFRYNSIVNGQFNKGISRSDSERHSKLQPFKRFSSRTKLQPPPITSSQASFGDVTFPFSISVEFDHGKQVNKKFTKGVLNTNHNLKDSVDLYIISQYSAQDLYSRLYQEDTDPLHVYPESFKISSLKVDLVSITGICCGQSVLEGSSSQCLLGKRNCDYTFDFTQFKKIKLKGKVYYKYQVSKELLDCVIRSDSTSFVSSSVKVDHQLQIKAEVTSQTSNNTKMICVNTDVLVFNGLINQST